MQEQDSKIETQYLQTLRKLYVSKAKFREIQGMQPLHKFNQSIGKPDTKFKTIHITGTNGKGSTALKVYKGLMYSGLKVGLFTGPHISTFRERIKVNDQLISMADVVKYANRVFEKIKEVGTELTFVERTFFTALLYFQDQEVDIAVIEVGMGGTFDGTNIIHPILSVVTSVDEDHLNMLGGSLLSIAQHKAGIIKPKIPVILGPQISLMDIFINRAKELESQIIIVEETPSTSNFLFINNAISRRALHYLKEKYFKEMTQEQILNAVHQNMPCRMERVPHPQLLGLFEDAKAVDQQKVKVYLDIATNLPALEALLSGLSSPDHEIWIVCGYSATKDRQKIFTFIGSKVARIFCVSSGHFLLTKAADLHADAKKYSGDKVVVEDLVEEGSVGATIERAIKQAGKRSSELEKGKSVIVIVLGSFFIMQRARVKLGYGDEKDPEDVNEEKPAGFGE